MIGTTVGIAVTAGTVTAVTRGTQGEPEAVLVDGWPTQTVNTRDDEQLAAAVTAVREAVFSDVDAVVVTYPMEFGSARTHRLRQAVEDAGWAEVAMVAAPVAVGITHSTAYSGGAVAVVDITGCCSQAAILTPQPNAAWGCVASRVTGQGAQSITAVIDAATTAADVPLSDVQRVVVIGVPPAVYDTTRKLIEAGFTNTVVASPVDLAADGIAADTVLAGGGHRSRQAARPRGLWPRPVSSLACAIASVVALAVVIGGAGSVGAQPDTTTFALACLALFTAVMGAASYRASQLVAKHPGAAGWKRAGRAVVIGAGIGVAGVVAAIVVVAAEFAVPAWPLVLSGGLSVVPSAIVCGIIAAAITRHPDSPPTRHLWPPVGAMTAVAVAAVFVHNTGLDTYVVSGWDLAPARIGIGVWIFAITGLVIPKPWPRVLIGLGVGAAAGLVSGPSTVMVFAVVVIAVVSSWWLITVSLVSYDHHGLPTLTPPRLPEARGQHPRTVH